MTEGTAFNFTRACSNDLWGKVSYCPWFAMLRPAVAYSSEPANANANAIMAEQTGAAPPKTATSPVDNSSVACCLPDGSQRENGQNSWWDTGNGITWWLCDSSLPAEGKLCHTDELQEARKWCGINQVLRAEGGPGGVLDVVPSDPLCTIHWPLRHTVMEVIY